MSISSIAIAAGQAKIPKIETPDSNVVAFKHAETPEIKIDLFTKVRAYQAIIRRKKHLKLSEASTLQVLVDQSVGYGNLYVKMPMKQLASMACICENTARSALGTLEREGFIMTVFEGDMYRFRICMEVLMSALKIPKKQKRIPAHEGGVPQNLEGGYLKIWSLA